MKEVSERLGPILPRMRGRVFTNKALTVIGTLVALVIAIESASIVLRSVSEDQVEGCP